MKIETKLKLMFWWYLFGTAVYIIFISLLLKKCFADELPIYGIQHKMKADELGAAFTSYFPCYGCPGIDIYYLQNNTHERVPYSEGRLIYGIDSLYHGFDVSVEQISVAWCVDNNSIHYNEKDRTSGTWQYYGEIWHDSYGPIPPHTGQGFDTNRSDIAISESLTMVVVQSDYRIKCLIKYHNDTFFTASDITSPQISEPTHPVVRYAGNGIFYCAYSNTMNGGRSIEISKYQNGQWTVDHQFQAGITDAPGFQLTENGYLVSSILWTGPGYSKMWIGEKKGSNFIENVIYQGNIASDDTHPPSSMIASDGQNVIACHPHDYPGDKGSYCQTRSSGLWSRPDKNGNETYHALVYSSGVWHLIYNDNGSTWYDRSGAQTPTPTPTQSTTPTAVATATPTPTSPVETPTVGTTPIPTGTPVPTDTPGICPTPVCWWQWWGYGIGCRW
jgi:hypothetical protein